MGTQYVIDSETMTKIADPLRSLEGRSDPMSPAEMQHAGNAVVETVETQADLLAQLEAVLSEKAAGGGGIDADSFRVALVIGGIFAWLPSPIVFTEGMTWADFCDSPLNMGRYDNAGPIEDFKPFLRVHNGRVIVNMNISTPRYLVRNYSVDAWEYNEDPQSGDAIVAPTDPIEPYVNYNTRRDYNWE